MNPDAAREAAAHAVAGLAELGAQTVAPVPPPADPPPAIPDHQLLRCIGRGSYGEVWLGRSVLGEYRAVKVIRRGTVGDNRPFEREFEGIQRYEPISRSHESQVQILHVGINQPGGYFYYVMELADDASAEKEQRRKGEKETAYSSSAPLPLFSPATYVPKTLRHELERHGRLPPAQCADIGLALTTALAHLHKQGLVHRDIKPSNIIFVKGRPKLADIGLVTDAGDAQSIVGTEGYLAPEGPGTAQADIYALGMVLYEISTGRDRRHFPDLPLDFGDRSSRREEAHASKSEIRNPKSEMDQSLLTSAATGLLELNEILLKACARDARQRYQSAEEMHADLELLQRGESVKARRTAQRRWAFTWKTGVAVAAVALVVTVGWQLFYGLAFQRLSAPISRPVIPREAKVIAVLPFDNESLDKGDDYLGKQMAEELSTALSRIPSLRVLGRDSAAALKTAQDRRTVAQQRKLVAVLDGRVRKSATQLHLAAQLINPADGLVLWSDDCDGEIRELSALQTRLAEGVVKALTGKLTDADRERLAVKATRNPEAYQHYLEGRGFCDDEGLPFSTSWDLARARFQSAIDLDPHFAAAYAGLAGCYHVESRGHKWPKEVLQKALSAAEKAVELDDTLAEAHTALGWTKYRLYDWEGAGKAFELAVRFGPNLVSAHQHYAKFLTSQGRFGEAIAHSRQAAELDPDSTALGVSLGLILFSAHQYDQAQEAFETVLNSTPNFVAALDGLGWCHFVKGRHDEAVAHWARAFGKYAALSQAYKQTGMQGFWRKQREQSLEDLSRGEYVDPFWIAGEYAMGGDTNPAFEWLERAYEQHSPAMPLVAVKNQFDNLHSDPRFAALLKKMGLKMPVWKQ